MLISFGFMKKNFSAEIIYLPQVYEIAYKVSVQITGSDDTFDTVIAIARGGMPPARIICDFLNIDTFTSLQIKHYSGGGKEIEEVEIRDPVDIDIRGRNVLIVDDINDSGKTLNSAYDHVVSLGPSVVKTAVLHEKVNTVFDSHFVGERIYQWRWVIYQWAVTEDLLEFLHRDNMLSASEDDAIKHLTEKYKLRIDKNLFSKVISMKDNYFKV